MTKWKIIGTDNFARESVAESLVCENIESKAFAETMAEALNYKYCSRTSDPTYYVAVQQDHVLWRGMADLVGDDG